MRLLHIGKFYPPFAGGMEYFLADLLPALRSRGIPVAALVHHEVTGGPGRRPGSADAIPVYRAPCHGRLLYAPISPAFPAWLNRAIREFQPDALHLHLPNTSAFAALMLPAARRLPWVIHWHSDVVASTIDARLALAYRLYRPFEQRLLARAALIFATSPAYLESSPALAPWRDRCRVVPLGLDPARIPDPAPNTAAQAERLWNRGGFRILSIGRLTYYKGHDTLIQAAVDVPDARLLIIGTGDREQKLRALTRSLGLEARVGMPGFQPDPMLHALLASCDILCLPSLERTEAFGLVLLEAMRFGKPVVVSDIPGSGTGWVVHQAGHGLLTPPGDPPSLAAAIRRLQADEALRKTQGQSGADALREKFGIVPVADAIADALSPLQPLI